MTKDMFPVKVKIKIRLFLRRKIKMNLRKNGKWEAGTESGKLKAGNGERKEGSKEQKAGIGKR